MLKCDELKDPKSCFNKAAPEEPVFVLRAKDAVAAQTVRHWATMAVGVHEPKKIESALQLADAMDTWRQRNVATEISDPVPAARAR